MIRKEKTESPALLSSLAPWTAFLAVTLSNYLLAYGTFPSPAKIALFLGGILLPTLWLLWRMGAGSLREESFYLEELFPFFPAWFWIALTALVLFTRFWKINSLLLWPMGDEALHAMDAIRLSQNWDWSPLISNGLAPFVMIWMSGLLFKFCPSAFFDLWFPPAFLSCLTVVLGVLLARKIFSQSHAFLFGFLLAVNYWALRSGREFLSGPLLLWEVGVFFLWATYLKSPSDGKRKRAATLGVCAGLGYLFFPSWVSVSLFVFLAFLFEKIQNPRKNHFWAFTLPFLATLTPLGFEMAAGRYGKHVGSVGFWNPGAFSGHPFSILAGYISLLFWGCKNAAFTPPEGGILNPLLGTFFFMGLVQWARCRRAHWARWLLAAFLLFFLPGWLSNGLEGFRVLQLLPLLLGVILAGFHFITKSLPRGWALPVGAFFLLFSLAFDFSRMIQPYLDVEKDPQSFLETGKSLARYRAYQVLEEMKNHEGPGYVLGEWDIPSDRTMGVMTYFFNASDNHALAETPATWLAVLMDAHYKPFLQKRFPDAKILPLDSDFIPGGKESLVILHLEPSTQKTLIQWNQASRAFLDLDWGIDHVYDRDCLERLNGSIRADYPLIQGDPFLESAYWEKVAYFYYYYSGHYPEHLRALQLAVQRGYPAAHLYSELAELYTLGGQKALAQEASQKARQSETEFPWR